MKHTSLKLQSLLEKEAISVRDLALSIPSTIENIRTRHGLTEETAQELFTEAKNAHVDQSVDEIMRWLAPNRPKPQQNRKRLRRDYEIPSSS